MTRRMALHDGNRRWWTLAAMCFAVFMIMLDNTVVNVALPSIRADLEASFATLEWTVSAYTLSLGVLLITWRAARRHLRPAQGLLARGRRLRGVELVHRLLADRGMAHLRARRSGIGAALTMPATLSIVTNTLPPHDRARAIGTWAGVSAVAPAIGPVVGGYLVEYVSWQSIFFLNLPVALGAIAITLFATSVIGRKRMPASSGE